MKKILIIIIFLIVLIGGYIISIPCENFPNIAVLKFIYNIKCTSSDKANNINIPQLPTTQKTEQNTNQENLISDSNKSKIKKISETKLLKYTITPNNEILAVNQLGKIIIINTNNGNEEIINDYIGETPINILFSNDGSKIIFIFQNSINIFDKNSKTWNQINDEVYSPAISLNNKLAYFKKDNNKNSIYVVDLNKQDFKPIKIIDLNILDSKLIWKDDLNIFIVSKPSSLNVGHVLNLNIKNKTIKLIYELPGLDFDWDEKINSGLLFYSGQLNKGGNFNFVNNNFEAKKFSFLTLPLKCVFEKNNQQNQNTSTINNFYIFCAVPQDQNLLNDKLVIDDYLTYDIYTEDNFYKIDVNQQLINNIPIENQLFDAINLKVFNNKLFFINRFDKNLYSIDL